MPTKSNCCYYCKFCKGYLMQVGDGIYIDYSCDKERYITVPDQDACEDFEVKGDE